MGACATKPKVLKDDAKAPAPAPEQTVKEEQLAAAAAGDDVAEAKEKEVLVEEEKKVVERELKVEAAGDDKRQSLSSLLKENEEVKESTEGVSEKASAVIEPAVKAAVEAEPLKEETLEAEIKVVEEPPVVKPAEEPLPAEESKEVVVEEAPTPVFETVQLETEILVESTPELPAAQARDEPLVFENPLENLDLAPVEPKPELPAAEIPSVAVEAEAKSEEAAEKKPEESK